MGVPRLPPRSLGSSALSLSLLLAMLLIGGDAAAGFSHRGGRSSSRSSRGLPWGFVGASGLSRSSRSSTTSSRSATSALLPSPAFLLAPLSRPHARAQLVRRAALPPTVRALPPPPHATIHTTADSQFTLLPLSSPLSHPNNPPYVPPHPHPHQQLPQDVGGAALVAGAAGVWLQLWARLATAGKVDSKDSRKIIHCGSGPLFLLCWPFFSSDPSARFLAAAVPLLQAIAVTVAGLSKPSASSSSTSSSTTSLEAGSSSQVQAAPTATNKNKPAGLVAAISRSGNPAEVLRGPLIYVIVLIFATLLFWRSSPIGLVAVAQVRRRDLFFFLLGGGKGL